MTDQPLNLRPATPDELQEALAFALRFDGRKAYRNAGEPMARITAEHLARQLELSGFVVMKKPPCPASRADGHKLDGYKAHLTE